MARILVVEKDTLLRRFLCMVLRRAGHDVEAVSNGAEALAALRDAAAAAPGWDMLLANLTLPGLEGAEVARRAAAHRPDLRILLITGFTAVAMMPPSTGRPDSPVLSKPFHLRELVRQIDRMLAA